MNGQSAADTLEGLYNGANGSFTPNTDIDLVYLEKIDQEGGGLAPFLDDIVIKDGDPDEIIAATFTKAGFIFDYYAIKAGPDSILFAVSSPGDSFSFDTERLGDKGVSHIVLFGRRAPPPIPEPATWAMMLGGFGLLGAAMRRRQRPAVTFA